MSLFLFSPSPRAPTMLSSGGATQLTPSGRRCQACCLRQHTAARSHTEGQHSHDCPLSTGWCHMLAWAEGEAAWCCQRCCPFAIEHVHLCMNNSAVDKSGANMSLDPCLSVLTWVLLVYCRGLQVKLLVGPAATPPARHLRHQTHPLGRTTVPTASQPTLNPAPGSSSSNS